jgi:hypothetical protein
MMGGASMFTGGRKNNVAPLSGVPPIPLYDSDSDGEQEAYKREVEKKAAAIVSYLPMNSEVIS